MKKRISFTVLFVFAAAILFATGIVNTNRNNMLDYFMDRNRALYNEIVYSKLWEKVDSLDQKGLPKSALEVVNEIYDKAKEDENNPQFVKAVIYKMKYIDWVEDDALVKMIIQMNEEAKSAKEPVKSILHSMIAEIYWNYYQNNRYKFFNRTETVQFTPNDIRTWDLNKLMDEVTNHFELSIKEHDILKKIPIREFEIILNVYDESPTYRPTLYDFLAHRAIGFFMHDEVGLTRPAYKFEIDKEEFYAKQDDFVKLKIKTKDTSSLHFHALLILQDLVAFHLNDDKPEALIDVDLKRLKFVNDNSITENKEKLYLKALQGLEAKFAKHAASAEVSYEIANLYNNQAANYKPLVSDDHKWDRKTARDICEKTIEKFPKSFGARNCKHLLNVIEKSSIIIKTESENLINRPFRAYVEYTNLDTVYFRAYAVTHKKLRNLNRKYYGKELLEEFVKLDKIKSWQVTLENDGDYQGHATEIKVPELKSGKYIIMACSKKDFSTQASIMAYSEINITDISYVSRRLPNGSFDVFVMHRESGSPLQDVTADAYIEKYNYVTREYELRKAATYKTNEDGHFNIPNLPENSKEYSRYFYFNFKKGEDQFFDDKSFSQYRYYRNNQKSHQKSFYFTDRKIYRPGQTIYFKGIMIRYDGDKRDIVKDESVTVELYNVNHQKVKTLKLKTNEYGTYSGSFTAPSTGLTGQMYIKDMFGQVYFQVEEYKRPKFEVSFEPVKGSYRLNEEVKVVGKAKAYAGNNIDGAEVKYRIVRRASFPYWFYWYWGPYISSPEMEILNGTAKTDENGEFEVVFNAIPDKSVSKKFDPTFTYTIHADVTDINGETRSSDTYVRVGYKALKINVNIPEMIEKGGENKFKFSTTNLGGEPEPANGRIVLYKLKQPERIFRDRMWQRPDRFTMTESEYHKMFPNDIYNDENNKLKWEKLEKVMDVQFSTPEDSMLVIDNLKSLKLGEYVLEVKTKDKYGEDVEHKSYFTLFAKDENKIPVNKVDWFKPLSYKAEPGEDVSFLIGTADDGLKVLYEIEHKGKIIQKNWLKLNKEQKLIKIPVKEEYRGNFVVHTMFVRDNRIYHHDQVFIVPYSNKRLDISFETFRNKLQPGAKEEWKIKIKGPKGEKVASEMVTALYDASLDAFAPNNWYMDIYQRYYSSINWDTYNLFDLSVSQLYDFNYKYIYLYTREYDYLNWFGFTHYYYGYGYGRGMYKSLATGGVDRMEGDELMIVEDAEEPMEEISFEQEQKPKKKNGGKNKEDNGLPPPAPTSIVEKSADSMVANQQGISGESNLNQVKARTNFNETAFFYPHLETDEEGNVIVKFTIPESLTKWKMLGFAHTKDLKFSTITNELVTQKDLMIVPNPPRFFRENDKITFSAKISNISDKDLKGQAKLMLFNGIDMQPIDAELKNLSPTLEFEVEKGRSTSVSWALEIPEDYQVVTYRVVAKAEDFSDGEEMAIPVLSNRMLVTESLPLPIRGNSSKEYTFEKLVNSNKSKTLKHERLTLEFTSNPAWYAVQALPYLMEYPYECSEQTFSRYYANSMATHIANSSPKIKRVFDTWKNIQPDALLSNLEKNQELKELLLEETPWVLNAKDESERKRRVGLLFDLNRMSNELSKAETKLIKMQAPNGGWPWFEGMPDNRYITQHIITGFAHLDHLGIENVRKDSKIWNMVRKGVQYLDHRIREDYEWILKHYPSTLNDNHLGSIQIHYLYARSYFMEDIPVPKRCNKAFEYYKGQAQKYWLKNNKYLQGMIALALHRFKDDKTPADIMKSIKEHALYSEELGMYWKDTRGGYYWYQAPIETHALLIEAFDEVSNDQKSVEELKIWLLKQKQTQDWKTTKATVEACYALLLKGTDLLASDKLVEIALGGEKIDPTKMEDVDVEAGTGYFKTTWDKKEIKPKMGNVKVTKTDDGVAWGALYWQYFEQLDKITVHETPLKLQKKLFIEKPSDTGPVLVPVNEDNQPKVGDKIKVRIELRVDRDMEYVHMKDMRASGFEPINVISRYKYQDGLHYYESTRDAATNFFISYLPKGTFVFEYPLFVSHKGDFSNGITTIQCMYAPEFTSHSEGVRVVVE